MIIENKAIETAIIDQVSEEQTEYTPNSGVPN